MTTFDRDKAEVETVQRILDWLRADEWDDEFPDPREAVGLQDRRAVAAIIGKGWAVDSVSVGGVETGVAQREAEGDASPTQARASEGTPSRLGEQRALSP